MKSYGSKKAANRNKKGSAMGSAAYEKAKEFGRLLREGAFDYPFTNEEIERVQG